MKKNAFTVVAFPQTLDRAMRSALATAGFLAIASGCTTSVGVDARSHGNGDDDDDDGGPVVEGSCNDPDLFATLKHFAETELEEAGVPGGAIAIVCNGQLTFSAGVGVTKRGGSTPVDADTRFQLASVTKGFTAAAAVSLEEDGLLDLSAPVSAHVASPVWGSIPLEMFLTHTSGFSGWFDNDEPTLEGTVTQAANQPLWAAPGEVFDYSNAGYSIAGQVVVVAAGKPFAQVIQERVFGPAGMTRATMSVPEVVADGNYASGSEGTEVIGPQDGYYDGDWYGPMGGAWSSVRDLAHWAEAHVDPSGTSALSAAGFANLRSPRTPTMWADRYGLGLEVFDSSPEIVMHSGSTLGYQSDWLTIPEDGFAVIALINQNGLDGAPTYYPQSLTWKAVDLYYPNLQYPPYPDSRSKAECVGTYESLTLGTVQITEQGGALLASFEGSAPIEMTWLYGDSWYATHPTEGEIDLAFWPPGAGPAEYVVGRYGVGKRP